MPADDPISALQSLNVSEQRQRSPVSGLARHFLQAIRLIAPPDSTFGIDAVGMVIDWVGRREEENRNEFVNLIAEEVKSQRRQIDRLIDESEDNRRFVQEELPGLVLDGLRRAERVRSKERIRRLARILVNAAVLGPIHDSDYVEELMRTAVDLTERDVMLLGLLYEKHPAKHGPGAHIPNQTEGRRIFPHVASNVWVSIDWAAAGFSEHDVESISGKLQSFGLIARLDLPERHYPLPYELLAKGIDLVDYLRRAESAEDVGSSGPDKSTLHDSGV